MGYLISIVIIALFMNGLEKRYVNPFFPTRSIQRTMFKLFLFIIWLAIVVGVIALTVSTTNQYDDLVMQNIKF